MPLDLVIFDCDGVLIDSEALACQVLAELLSAHGYAIDGATAARRFAGFTDREVAAVVGTECGLALPGDFAEQASCRAMEAFEGRLLAVPGAEDALAATTGPRCVASNSLPDRLERALEITGLRRYFPPDGLFSSAMVASGKPAPDLHLLAASANGAEPARCVVVEDSVTGVTAAVAAGMPAVGFVGAGHVEDPELQTRRLREAGARMVIADLRDLSRTLASLDC